MSAGFAQDCMPGTAVHESGPGSDTHGHDLHTQVVTQESMEQLQLQVELFVQANETLNALTARLCGYSSETLAKHRGEIAQLSVEIARRVLAQRVEDGDYDIEQVIEEAIGSIPADGDIAVHLNPEDLAMLQSARRESGQDGQSGNVRFVADPSVGRAECIVETSKGLIESRINEKLEQISGALRKAQ